jgi:hypothetical protein
MIHSIRIARKGGKVVCGNCGRRVESGEVYVRVKKKSYCLLCEGPGKKMWENLAKESE